MDDGAFWQAIDRSREGVEGDAEAQAEALHALLSGWAPEEVAAFDAAFIRHNLELCTWDLWAAAEVLIGWCSEDVFTDFRSWVVAQGRDYFEACRADPAVLADGRLADDEEVGAAEVLAATASQVYEDLTGGSIEEDFPGHPNVFDVDEPAGERLDEATIARRFAAIRPIAHLPAPGGPR